MHRIFLVTLLLISWLGLSWCAPKTTSRPSRDKTEDFQHSCLNAHSLRRARHGSPDLVSDDRLIIYAQRRADEIAKTGNFQTTRSNPYGENLFYYSSTSRSTTSYDCDLVVKSWYDTGRNYNYDKPDSSNNFNRAGTFTQVVWRSTERLGCAQANDGEGKIYTVCNYDPPGNVQQQYAANVRRPTGDNEDNST